MLETSSIEDKETDPEEQHEQQIEVNAHAILDWLAHHHEEAFLAAAQNLGYPIITKKMPVETAAAMFDEAGMTINATRIVSRYLRTEFGTQLLPSEEKVKRLGSSAILPTVSFYRDNKGNKIYYWYKNVDEVIEECLSSFFENNHVVFDQLDIVVGGDHGKGKFREVVKLVMHHRGDLAVEQAKSPVCEVGKIYCKKDNYQVLKKSIVTS